MNSPTLANFRTETARKLSDPTNIRFDTSDIDQALRQALEEYSRARSIERTYIVDGANESRLTLPADFAAVTITRIEYDPDGEPTEADSIPFHAEKVDEQWTVETTDQTIPIGDTITIYYSALHTIDSLDSASGSTLPAQDWQLIVTGAAGFAAQSRAAELGESINLNASADKRLDQQAQAWLKEFRAGLTPKPGGGFASWNTGTMDTNFG